MSDSESFESQRDTEQSTDNEDLVEPQSSLVHGGQVVSALAFHL